MHQELSSLPNDNNRRPRLRVALVTSTAAHGEVVARLASACAEIELVGHADTETEAVRLYFHSRPEVMVLDSRLIPDEPARLLGMLKRIAPNALIVSLVPSLDSMQALAVKAVGADRVATPSALGATLAALA
ncbi:MAG TPA: two-component system response regulator [Azoarcus taiwanensis]|nr:two-component system response regulator [Azoarcus taiwanensis]